MKGFCSDRLHNRGGGGERTRGMKIMVRCSKREKTPLELNYKGERQNHPATSKGGVHLWEISDIALLKGRGKKPARICGPRKIQRL